MVSLRHVRILAGILGIVVALSWISLSAQTTSGKVQPWDNATWKVNVAKSKYNPASATPKSQIVKREAIEGGGVKITLDQVDSEGKAIHEVNVAKYDGKDYPVQGTQPGVTRAYRLIDGGYELINKLDGKVLTTVRFVLSPDGKTATSTTTGTNIRGRKDNHTVVWEKQ